MDVGSSKGETVVLNTFDLKILAFEGVTIGWILNTLAKVGQGAESDNEDAKCGKAKKTTGEGWTGRALHVGYNEEMVEAGETIREILIEQPP